VLTLTVKEPDGIADVSANTGVSVYPNPASERITLKVETATGEVSGEYRLYDAIGRTVATGRIEAAETTIATARLATGTYFLRVFLTDDDIRTLKVVKQ